MDIYAVGERSPLPPVAEGMTALIEATPEIAALQLICAMDEPKLSEIRAMTNKPLRLGILPAPPLVWIVLSGDRISFDAPYAIGLHGAEGAAERVAAAAKSMEWNAQQRGVVAITLINTRGNVVAGLRNLSLSRAWHQTLAQALAASPATLSPAERDAAVARDYRRYAQTSDMLAACRIVERGGAL